MPKKVKIRDDMNSPLNALLDKYEKSAGTDRKGSMRDVLTELRRMCATLNMSFNDLITASSEVYTEELALILPGDPIRAEIHSDDYKAVANFDARRWFMQASNTEIADLRSDGWGGETTADDVARFLDGNDDEVSKVFGYLNTADSMGFEVHICDADALRWLRKFKPQLFNKLYDADEDGDLETVGKFDHQHA